jgi:hypothetical protein
MTRGVMLLYNGATPFSVVLPARGGARETAARVPWYAAGRMIAHAAAPRYEETRLKRCQREATWKQCNVHNLHDSFMPKRL